MDVKTSKPKEKRRNNEKRKEKSRDAARCRRSRETEIFSELASSLPLNREEVEQLDKASVMRLAISYLKVRAMIPQVSVPSEQPDTKHPINFDGDAAVLKALDGFLLVLAADGDIVYVSNNVNEYLGISQVDLLGQSIYDFSHPCDHDEFKDVLLKQNSTSLKHNTESIPEPKSLFARLKCTLTSKGRSVNIKSATYKVIHCTGHILNNNNNNDNSTDKNKSKSKTDEDQPAVNSGYFVAVGRCIPHPSNIEVPLDCKTFLTKHNLKFQYTYVDDKMKELLGYEQSDLLEKSVFDCHHAGDSEHLLGCFKSLFSKGQSETARYRFLGRAGGFAWVVTQSTIIYDKGHKPQSIVCVHYMISDLENCREIYSTNQLAASKKTNEVEVVKAVKIEPEIEPNKPRSVTSKILGLLPLQSVSERPRPRTPVTVTSKIFAPLGSPRPQTATAKIFAPRTEEMNKGFLMFSEEDGQPTMLKEEPDDLTHLAPTAGDACIPLADDNHPFLSDMFDDFILSDNYCSLLNECNDFTTPTSQNDDSSCSNDAMKSPLISSTLKDHSGTSISPFINTYNDIVSNCMDVNISCNDDSSDLMSIDNNYLLSPALSKSPGTSSLPSLCSPGDSYNDDSDYQNDKTSFSQIKNNLHGHKDSHLNNRCINENTIIMDTSPNLGDDDYMDEFTMRAPYIPMNDVDDLPLLMSDDLMWGALPEQLTLSHKEFKYNYNMTPINTAIDSIDTAIDADNTFAKEEDIQIQSTLQQLLCDNNDLKNKNANSNINNKTSVDFDDPTDILGQVYNSKKSAWNNTTVMPQTPIVLSEEAVLKVNNINNNNNNNNINSNNKKISTKRPNQIEQTNFVNCKRIRNNENNNINKNSQLLQQLISTPLQKCEKNKLKNNLNYLRDSGGPNCQNNQHGRQQHSDSVLMNLLVSGCDDEKSFLPTQDRQISSTVDVSPHPSPHESEDANLAIPVTVAEISAVPTIKQQELLIRNPNLHSGGKYGIRRVPSSGPPLIPIPSLLKLNQMDYEVNAPVGPVLLQGTDILTALDGTIIT